MPTLNWIGKDKVLNHHLEVPFHVLERQYSFDEAGKHEEDNGSENMIIHGDNLLALKSLLPKYEGKIKCIYIDPPYNTGNENWVYNDNVNDPQIQRWLHQVVGKEGEDLSRHDKWLCMMYPRLKLLQRLLADDGVIFISIDDNEQANLKLICDEIFGQNSFITQVVWQKRTSPDARKIISAGHEYVLVYCKSYEQRDALFNKLELNEDDKKKFKNPDNDPRGPWVSTDCTAQAGHGTENQFYDLVAPNGKVHKLSEGRCWVYTEQVMKEKIADNRIWFGKDGNGVPRRKNYLAEREGKNLWSWWTNQEVGHTQEATKEISVVLGKSGLFDYPKPLRLIHRIIQIATNKNSIVLDSFAGSGTTAHAVLNMNKADGGNRKFICIEMMDYADTITAERVKRVINGYGEGKKSVNGTGGNFSYYELGEPLLVDDKLNNAVCTEKIREYIYYMETKQALPEASADEPMLLGVHHGTAYYFNYEKDASTTLNAAFLKSIKTQAEAYVIYADTCVISENKLQQFNITFKKIPRDIARL